MHKNEADLFTRFAKFLMNLDKNIVIDLREIYIIYVLIIIRIMEKAMKNNILLPHNSPA
jgi:hypothetical protein